MGYSSESKAYRIYNPTTKKIITSRDVVFIEAETKVYNNNLETTNSFSLHEVVELDELDSIITKNTNSGGDSINEFDIMETADDPIVNSIDVPAATDNEADESVVEISDSPVNDEEDSEVFADTLNDADFSSEDIAQTVDQVRQSIRIASQQKPNYRPPNYGFNVVDNIPSEPSTFDEAMAGPNAELWKKAMNNEYESLISNKTWSLVELPENKRAIQNKWVFKIKRNACGEVEKFKARLVAKGYSQIEGIDYNEVFSPVVRYTSIRYLIALAAKLKLHIRQMDAVTAFLNGELHEDVYMRQPKGYDDNSGKVCKLKRSLYGLKQSSRIWNQTINDVFIKFGLNRSKIDQCIYFSVSTSFILIVAIYVDDVLIFSNNTNIEAELMHELCNNFKMKDMGNAVSVLGVRICRNNDNSISIDQSHYINEILNRFGMHDCNPVSTPADPNQKLTSSMCPKNLEDKNEMSKKPYMQAIGSLLFASQVTRPDISYAVNLVSRFGSNPGKPHWHAVKRIFRYLKGTANKKLVFHHESTEIEGYCDADYAGELDGRRTTTGYAFMFQGGAISWTSKLQKRVTISSTESEYIAMVAAAKESIWLKQLENEMVLRAQSHIILHCDNKSAMEVAKNNSYSDATKHIDVKTKFLHQLIQDKKIQLVYLPTNEMIADALTKGLPKIKLDYFTLKLGLKD